MTFSCLVVQPPHIFIPLLPVFFFPLVAEVVWCLNWWNYAPK